MEFNIKLGVPEMKALWDDLKKKYDKKSGNKNEHKLFEKLLSCFKKLSLDPRYPSLCTHDIEALSKRYGIKVWESYLENKKPGAGRIFWVYGPNQNDITIIALEPHPNDKKDAYEKITLSSIEE